MHTVHLIYPVSRAVFQLALLVSCWAHLTLWMSKESAVEETLAMSSLLWAL